MREIADSRWRGLFRPAAKQPVRCIRATGDYWGKIPLSFYKVNNFLSPRGTQKEFGMCKGQAAVVVHRHQDRVCLWFMMVVLFIAGRFP